MMQCVGAALYRMLLFLLQRTSIVLTKETDLYATAQTLEKATAIEEIWQGLATALLPLGITHHVYLTVKADRSEPHLNTSLPALHATTATVFDPFLDYCCASYAPTCTGAAFLDDYDYLAERDRAFILKAADMGFQSGLGIPMRLIGSDRFGGFNLGTAYERARFEREILPLQESLRVFCLLVHRRLEELLCDAATEQPADFRARMISPADNATERLTPREKEILFLLAKGFSRRECAELCRISQHTVSDYIKGIYEKLEVSNKVEASRIAFESGLV